MDCMQFSQEQTFAMQISFSFNTASGMDCMQYPNMPLRKWKKFVFQYRKRYGLHAICFSVLLKGE